MAFTTAILFACWSRNIDVNPLDRWGQVSGIAAMGFRFTVVSALLVAALAVAAKVRGGKAFDITSRLVCAAVAGLFTGMVAGGIVIALRGTLWGLNGNGGDANDLINWTIGARQGKDPPLGYPPLAFYLTDLYARIRHVDVFNAVKHMEILGTAALGPVAYLSWRLVFRPGWALGIGMIAALPLIDTAPYKPYTSLVLISLIPCAIRLLDFVRRADRYSNLQLARRGAAMGLAFGVLCLLYSGWFKWSTPGIFLALLIVFPWRSRAATGKALVFGAVALGFFALLAHRHVLDALSVSFSDDFHYFDVKAEPGYIAMFRNDMPGDVGMWPPLGELGGVGLFTILLCAGFGASVVFGRGRTLVITIGSLIVGCWLLRFYYARDMHASGLVQLYPRTTQEILYCLLISCGYAGYLAVERFSRRGPLESARHTPSRLIGAVCGLLLLFGSAASSISDHYMPTDSRPLGPGILAWNAQQQRKERPVAGSATGGPGMRTVTGTELSSNGFNWKVLSGGWSATGTTVESSNTCMGCVVPAMAAVADRTWGDLVTEFTVQITNQGSSDQNWAGVTIHKASPSDGLAASGHLIYYRANGTLEVSEANHGILATVDTKLAPTATARRVRVEANGKHLRVFVDDVQFVDTRVNTLSSEPGYVDLISYGVTARYSDFKVFFRDSFSRADTFMPPDGAYWTLSPTSPAFGDAAPGAFKDQMVLDPPMTPSAQLQLATPRKLIVGANFTADVTLRVSRPADTRMWGGFSFRKKAETDTVFTSGYTVYLRANGQLTLFAAGGGDLAPPATLTCAAPDCFHQIRIWAVGSRIRVSADGVQVFDVTNTAYAEGYTSLVSYGAESRFESLEIF